MADSPTNKKIDLSSYYVTGQVGLATGMGVVQDNMTPNYHANFQLGMGLNAPMLDVATPCTFTPAVIVVTSVPAMYMIDGKPTCMGVLIKNLLETHAKSVTGIDFGYTLGTDTAANAGHDSQNIAVPTKTTRSAVNPNFTFTELSGNLVFNCFKRWIWDIQHPDTNASMAQVQFPGAWTMSAYSASFMVIQFDPTMRPDRIIDAAHYCNVFPTETGQIGFERTIGTVKPLERSIPFTGIVQHNIQTKAIAIEIAEKLKLHVHNYDLAPVHKRSIDEMLADTGYEKEMSDMRQEKYSADAFAGTTDRAHDGTMNAPNVPSEPIGAYSAPWSNTEQQHA